MMAYKFLKKFESIFVVTSLICFWAAFIPFLSNQREITFDPADGDSFQQFIFLCIYSVTIILLFIQLRQVKSYLFANKTLWLLFLFTVLSVFWSDRFDIAIRRVIALFGTTLFGIYFAACFSSEKQIKLLIYTLCILMVSSIIFAILLPDYGLMEHNYDRSWQGVFPHKNLLGRAMVIYVMLLVMYDKINHLPRWFKWINISFSLAIIVLSNSAGALLLLIIIVSVYYFYKTLPLNYKSTQFIRLAMIPLLIGVSPVILLNLDFTLSFFNKDTTLTGRTNIWIAVIEMIGERPWFGYGYSNFWLGFSGPSINVWLATNWPNVPPHAHNGFLDLLLDLGIIGLILYLLNFAIAYVRTMRHFIVTNTSESLWPLIYLTLIMVINQTESAILKTNSIYWLLYVAVTTTAAVQRGASLSQVIHNRQASFSSDHKLVTR